MCNAPVLIRLIQEMHIDRMLAFDWMGIITIVNRDSRIKINGSIQGDKCCDERAEKLLSSLTAGLLELREAQKKDFSLEGFSGSLMAVPVRGEDKYRVFMTSLILGGAYDTRDLSILNFVTRTVYENALLNEEIILEKNYLQNVLNSTEISILSLDLEGNITLANDATLRIFNLESSVLDLNIYHCIPEKERGRLHKTVDYVIRNNTTYTGQGEIFETTGGTKVINTAISPLNNGQGQVIGVVIISSDITRQKILEREIEQIKQFAVLGEMAAGVAHDIKNPLMSIRGCARLLEEDLQEQKAQQEFIKPIIEEVDRINDVVEHMLNFARMAENSYSDVNINEILNKCINFIRFQRHAKQIVFSLPFDKEISNIKGSAVQLQQAFINILLNSLQAITDKGHITVKTGLTPDKRMVEVVIRDTGTGIPPDLLDRIFTPFFSTKEGGTGLGLAIAEGVVKKHGGLIRFSSPRGGGTTCQVLLPVEGA